VTDKPDFHRSLRLHREVFAGAVTLAPSEGSDHNITVFAWKEMDGPPSFAAMPGRARALAPRHTVNLHAPAMRIEYGKKFNGNRYAQA